MELASVDRDQRVVNLVGEIERAVSTIKFAQERAALAIAAAQAVEADEVAAAEAAIEAGVRRLSAERLTIAEVAEFSGLPAQQVRRILRSPVRAVSS